MWQSQEIAGRLVDIIQKLQARRETGQLTAKQGNGATTEEAIIVFVSGRITEARVGRRSGSEALNRLSSWENCFYQFMGSGSLNDSTRSHPSSSLDWVSEATTGGQMTNTPLPSSSVYSSQPQTDPYGETTATNHPRMPLAPGVPYPVSNLQEAIVRMEQVGLSRTHRRLFLLVDGRRSISDLVRLMGRGKDDVNVLLRDLRRIAVIAIAHEPPLRGI